MNDRGDEMLKAYKDVSEKKSQMFGRFLDMYEKSLNSKK
jgi:hypothetical protein